MSGIVDRDPNLESASYDVVVVGSGNAGASAALSAAESGARVLVVDKAPKSWAGGNSYFTAGAFRTTYASLDALRPLINLTDDEASGIDLPPYSVDDFVADINRVTEGRSDPTLARIVATEASDALTWLRGFGVEWELMAARQSFDVGGRRRYWGNLVVGAVGGGRGLVESELRALDRHQVDVSFEAACTGFEWREDRIAGLSVVRKGRRHVVAAGAVVLASGGFQADSRRRASLLGPGWDLAKVRGTPFNTGDALFLAIDSGAEPHGHWSGCHAISWDASAPATGDRVLTNRFSRQGYPFGLMVNRAGRRFVDEGADFRNYTYARYGAEVLRQPGSIAYQLFDARSVAYVSRVDYETARESRVEGESIASLADGLHLDPAALVSTVEAFNAAVGPESFDPTIKDGKGTRGLALPKSNWALQLTEPPFVAFAVTCGITFTFGGLRIDADGAVVRPGGGRMEGLFAAGELVGGLFYHNYPGGSGLTAGTVIGRRAGRGAAVVGLARRQPGRI